MATGSISREETLSQHKPKTDTCKTCDEFVMKIKEAVDNKDEEVALQLKNAQELHHRNAQAGQDDIKQQKVKASSENDYHVITFESIAGRGSEEIGSCVRKHIESNNINGNTLIAISDNCGGQNKNWTIQFMWLYYIATGRFKNVEHHFPLSGHSMLPSDRDFGLIENYVRKHVQQVYTPSHWREVITKSAQSLKVVEMTSEDFVKLTDLKGYFSIKQKNIDGDPVNFKNVVRFRMTAEQFDNIQTRPNFNSDVWNTVSVGRRGKTRQDVAVAQFPRKYDGPRALDKQKVADVVSLLPYIPPVYSEYFNTLTSVRKNDLRNEEEDNFCID